MTNDPRFPPGSARRVELDLHPLDHPEALVPDQFARDVLAKKRLLHPARRLFARYPVGWRIVQRVTYHLLAVMPDRQEAAASLGQALQQAIAVAMDYSENHVELGLQAEWRAFYTALLTPLASVIPAERLMSLTEVRDPWLGPGESVDDAEDEALNQFKAGKPREWNE